MKEGLKVRFRVSGLSVEKLLNEAQKQGIRFLGIQRESNRDITVHAFARDYDSLRQLAQEKGYQVGEAAPEGLLQGLTRLKRRMGLLVGAAIGIGLVIFALSFVWNIRIINAGPYEGEARAYLNELGVKPGTKRSQIDLGRLRDQLEWRLPQVKWIRTEWAGVSLRFVFEQGTPPPEIESEGKPGDVVASEDGVINRINTFAGTPMVKAGDFVRAGQILIQGAEKGANDEKVPVKARGEITARVWVSAKVRMPLTEDTSVLTGKEEERRALRAPFFAWYSGDAPDYLTCDKSISIVPLGGAWIPIRLIREKYQEVMLQKEGRSLEEVKEEGKKAAVFALNQALFSEKTVDKWLDFDMIEEGKITVTATAEVLRSIGRYQPY